MKLFWTLACASAVGTHASPQSATEHEWNSHWTSACSARCGHGTRQLKVICERNGHLVDDAMCQGDSRPDEIIDPCFVTCLYVDPEKGADNNTGSKNSALRSVAACVARAGTEAGNDTEVTRCILKDGRYTETAVDLGGRHRLIVEAEHKGGAVFDGTDPLRAEWVPHPTVHGALATNISLARLESLIVDMEALQRAEDFVTSGRPCFSYNGTAGDDVVPRPFSCVAAQKYFREDLVAIPRRLSLLGRQRTRSQRRRQEEDEALPSFWADTQRGRLYAIPSQHGGRPEVRVKNDSRRVAFTMGGGGRSEHVYLQGLRFLGATVIFEAPKTTAEHHTDIQIRKCRFLYHPSAVHLSTTGAAVENASSHIELVGNVFEFGEGSLFYKAGSAHVTKNLLVGNSLSDRGDLSVHGIAARTVLNFNSFLYNGDYGGFAGDTAHNVVANNLWLGQSFLSRQHDSAVVDIRDDGMNGLVCEDNWFLGPSMASSIRLNASQLVDKSRRNATIRRNVFLGHSALVLHGAGVVVEHNTGDDMQLSAKMDPWSKKNLNVWAQFNVVPWFFGRYSPTIRGGSAPATGHTNMNSCADLSACNPSNASLPTHVSALFQKGGPREVSGDVCSLLRKCHPSKRENVYKNLKQGFDELRPNDAVTMRPSQVRALDFRPAEGSEGAALILDATGRPGARGSYLGAYGPTRTKAAAPGCRVADCSRGAFVVKQPPIVYDPANSENPHLVPDAVLPKITQCHTMFTAQLCKNGFIYVLGYVKHPAECRTLCEKVSYQTSFCCGLTVADPTDEMGKCQAHTGYFKRLSGVSPLSHATDCDVVPTVAAKQQQQLAQRPLLTPAVPAAAPQLVQRGLVPVGSDEVTAVTITTTVALLNDPKVVTCDLMKQRVTCTGGVGVLLARWVMTPHACRQVCQVSSYQGSHCCSFFHDQLGSLCTIRFGFFVVSDDGNNSDWAGKCITQHTGEAERIPGAKDKATTTTVVSLNRHAKGKAKTHVQKAKEVTTNVGEKIKKKAKQKNKAKKKNKAKQKNAEKAEQKTAEQKAAKQKAAQQKTAEQQAAERQAQRRAERTAERKAKRKTKHKAQEAQKALGL